MESKPLPQQDDLKEIFSYSVITGKLTWKTKSATHSIGDIVSPIKTNKPYATVWVDGRRCKQSRVIWRLVTGEDPGELEVDHIDRDGWNNSWHNLRLASKANNCWNRGRRSDNSSGFKGVYIDHRAKNRPWRASIRTHGKRRSLGYFSTPEEAHAAYCEAAKQLHGDFARFH